MATTDDDGVLIERSTIGFMKWLHHPENAGDLNALRAQVDQTTYWRQLVSGDTDAEKNAARDNVISAAVKHLFTRSGVQVMNDVDHCRFYVSGELHDIDKADDFIAYQQQGGKWSARVVKDPPYEGKS